MRNKSILELKSMIENLIAKEDYYYIGAYSEIIDYAKKNNLIIVHGYSDDSIELVGAIDEEVGAWEETDIYVTNKGEILNLIEDNCLRMIKVI